MNDGSGQQYGPAEESIEWAIRIVSRRWRLRCHEAQDFAQEIRMYFLQHDTLSRGQGRQGHPRTYFLRIVTRRAIDWRRRRTGRDAGTLRAAAILPSDSAECICLPDPSASSDPSAFVMLQEQIACADRVA